MSRVVNVFVDVWGKPQGKVGKDLYLHLLVGFDPQSAQSPEYWHADIERKCKAEERQSGAVPVKGITGSLEALFDVLKDANALIIPAHMHSSRDAFKSRSIDDIYADPEFLQLCRLGLTALEVRSEATAAYFDGKHDETQRLYKACIQSSDSHEPGELGWRPTYVQMETVSYAELKAALELPFRTSRHPPLEPDSFIIGIHVKGQFLGDLWLSLSPHNNVLIGVKGSGKTSVLECLRYVLGTEVPASRRDSVQKHLDAILGPAGRVRALVKRSDGAKLLIERTLSDKAFTVIFEDDRQEKLSSAEGLLFPTHILGWHEIEQAAENAGFRQLYLNAIAGREQVLEFEERAQALGKEIRHKHDLAANRYSSYRSLHERVTRLEELRKGLQALTDANLIVLKQQYEAASDHREAVHAALDKIKEADRIVLSHVDSLLAGIERHNLEGESPLKAAMSVALTTIDSAMKAVRDGGEGIENQLKVLIDVLDGQVRATDEEFGRFAELYVREVAKLTPEQQRVLESHRKVTEETRDLARLKSERDKIKQETATLLTELMGLCEKVANILDERTRLRTDKIQTFNRVLEQSGVRLTVIKQQNAQDFEQLSQRYSNGAKVLTELRHKLPGSISHLCIRKEYGSLLDGLGSGYTSSVFDYSDFSYFLTAFEDDDLRVELKVGRPGQEFSPIEQLSAGQRCTAIFPVLLKLEQGPLIIDQPEDNLDNRHIASFVSPVLLADKRQRQMVFTSHNANLVVLSDPESIVSFESDGSKGWVECQGFLAMRDSKITEHVLNILDGGETALELRMRKYGRSAN